MLSEYIDEIYAYIKQTEINTMPLPNYMDTQKELSWQMRGVLIDWLVNLHGTFRMLPETLFICVNIVDRFLSCRVVSLVRFQLVGVASLFIAAKFEEMCCPSVDELVRVCDEGYTTTQVLKAEAYILKALGFDLSYPGPMSFLRRTSKADDYDPAVRTLAKYFIEIAIVDWRMLDVKPSLSSAAGIYFGRLVTGKGAWTPTLVHYSGYSEDEILPVVCKMVAYILRDGEQFENFQKKFARKAYMKASTFMREWAKARWPERQIIGPADILVIQRTNEKDAKSREQE